MQTRTIELGETRTASMGAGGKIIVRDDGTGDVEVLTAPRGRVCYDRQYGRHSKRGEITFGSLTRAVLVMRGPAESLNVIFRGVTGVDP